MSGFSAAWLALREPHDAAARAAELVGLLRTHPPMTRNGADAALVAREIVDLGSGSGANLRWLAPRLGGEQAWLLVDHDAALLAAAERTLLEWAAATGAAALAESPARGPGRDGWLDDIVVTGADFACRVRRARADLAADLERIELPERALVTSSALLDLVSAEWLDALARRCDATSADVYFALTYDGRTVCTPPTRRTSRCSSSSTATSAATRASAPRSARRPACAPWTRSWRAAIASHRARATGESARVRQRSSESCSQAGSARRSRSRRNAAQRSKLGIGAASRTSTLAPRRWSSVTST